MATVPHADDMDDETFCRHMNLRHRDSLGGLDSLWVVPDVIDAWRFFHKRLHHLRQMDYDHEHLL